LYGASNTLLKDLAEEDPSGYRRHLRWVLRSLMSFWLR
jgi:hypothetical protein